MRATAIELTASGMDVAAARNVSPEMMVGILETDSREFKGKDSVVLFLFKSLHFFHIS